MLRRFIVGSFLVTILGLASAGQAKADGLDNFKYTFDGHTYTWQLEASPTPGVFFENSLFEIDDVSYKLDGVSQTPGIFDFFPGGGGGGGFELSLGTNEIILNTFGDVLYKGHEDMPTFFLGKFMLNNDTADGPVGTLIISPNSAPEPGTLLLIGTGMLALLGIARKKLIS
jgi:hypothetical protein